ncbi:MAG: RNA polymerase sigma factor [Gemmatimonadetes bacterium]|nr:RNA polymerase sigma factor [Gemmatimonadota bacterium]
MEDAGPGVIELPKDTSTPTADRDVVDATLAASGDAQAFERLYQTHVARIHGLARRMLGPDDADEATQDVFVRAWEKLGTFRGESAFGTWLHRVAINVVLGKRQKQAIRRDRFIDGDEPFERLPARTAPEGTSLDLESAIEHLPKGARQVFVLHDVEGYKHHEIAEMLGVTTGTSKAQLHRARMTLRKHLDY